MLLWQNPRRYIGSLLQVKYQCPICKIITEKETHCDNKTDFVSGIKWFTNDVVNLTSCTIASLFSPAVASVILKEKLAITNSADAFENGYIGSIAGCKIYVSNNIKQEAASGSSSHKCIMRTKRAIAFAEQLSEIDAYRPEKRFADAVKGLHLYGAKVVYPAEMVTLEISVKA